MSARRPALRRVEKSDELLRRLFRRYPRPKTALAYGDPFQLLVAVILSAQCTDSRVNMVTPALFRRFPTPRAFVRADIREVEALIHSTGFFRNKAKNIVACSAALLERHGGTVPRSMDELHALPGVGRKTANVVLGEAFGVIEGVVVDTHVARLSGRMGFTGESDPVKIERDLMSIVPRKRWFHLSHALILHGRSVCSARSPQCGECALSDLCPASTIAAERPVRK